MRPRHSPEWASGRHGPENMVCDKKKWASSCRPVKPGMGRYSHSLKKTTTSNTSLYVAIQAGLNGPARSTINLVWPEHDPA
jgi:hypothetical protein